MTDKDLGVTLAKTAGFCPGVKKAIDRVLALAQSGKAPIYTLGPLIHNPQVIETLEEKNIRAVKSLSEIKNKTGVIVIRAHGVTPEAEAELRACGMEVVDATCPLVKRVHNVIAEYAAKGFDTVIVGDAGHAEVIGLLGYARGRGTVAADAAEAEKLPAFDCVNVVSQTTQDEEVFLAAAEAVRKKSRECVVSNTICQATRDRQRETRELASNADMVIVVGGKQSANTARLAQLCGALCPQVVLVESEEDLLPEQLAAPARIGVTAGASTPGWVTERVVNAVRAARKNAGEAGLELLEKSWGFFINSGVYSALAAVCLSYVAMKFEGAAADLRLMALAWLFVFSLTMINRAFERGAGASDRDKFLIFHRHRRLVVAAGLTTGIFSVALAARLGVKIFLPVALFWGLGMAYPFRRLLKIKTLIDFPGSKDLVTALGWGFVCACVPAFYRREGFDAGNLMALGYVILAVLVRSVLLGISAVKSDLIVGRESFYKALGSRFTLAALSAILLANAGWLCVLALHGWKPGVALPALVSTGYVLACLWLYYRDRVPTGVWAETVVDGQFLLTAVLVYAAKYLA
ncbi:MAG: 4-hydroxy-3-methylbut-2-enyl diphosphate reductase [Elusimicrobiales bacterium]|nr:4-hydroxy-3-methylbut-2-enyl diphosphate reductase [Elusimicrobiales bacterium]